MLFEGGTQKYTEIRRKEGDAVFLLKEIIQELFLKCKFFIKKLFRKHIVLVFSVFFVIKNFLLYHCRETKFRLRTK